MKTNRSSGVAIVEIILIVVFVGLVAGLGYLYFTSASKTNDSANQSSSQTDKDSVEEVSTIESTSDLDSAVDELDSLEIDDSSDDSSLKSIESSL